MCHGFRNTSRSVAEYLFDINDKLNELKGTEEDVIEVWLPHIKMLCIVYMYSCILVWLM